MAQNATPAPIVDCTIQVGKLVVPAFAWTIDDGTYGQIGLAVIRTSTAIMKTNGINLKTMTAQAVGQSNTPGVLYTPQSLNIPVQLSVNGVTKFGGYLMQVWIDFGQDDVEITVRDYSCVLFDSKTSIAEIQYQNVTVNQMVQEICNFKGLKAQINCKAGETLLVGTIFDAVGLTSTGSSQGGSTMSSYPQSYWNLITLLARYVNAQVYCQPSDNQNVLDPVTQTPGTLFFENIPRTPIINNFHWMGPPTVNGPQIAPAENIQVLWQPQRNKNFAVIFKSHHGPSVTTSIGSVVVNGQDQQTATNVNIPAGYYTGSAGVIVRNALSGKSAGIPVYEYREDGLTQSQVQAKAEAKAAELASKLFVQTILCDYDDSIKPLQQVVVSEENPGDLLGFVGQVLYITNVRHAFNMPQGEDYVPDGLQTVLKTLTVPPVANPMTGEDLSSVLGGI